MSIWLGALRTEHGRSIVGHAIATVVVWTIAIGALFVWSVNREEAASRESARISARAQVAKDVLYRRWNASHGGVYVPATERTQPNPFLAGSKRRDLQTTDDEHMTLINPAYMTRQVHELGYSTAGVRGHITSLKPIRPANAADPWERTALWRFEEGAPEHSSVQVLDGVDQMRLMRPLFVEQGCLKCHSEQGYQTGDVRGGISVAVPMQPYVHIMQREIRSVTGTLGVIWLFGFAAVVAAAWHIYVRTSEREKTRRDLRRSEAQLALVLSGSGLGSWDWDVSKNEVRFNKRWATMKGYDAGDIKPQMESWQRLIHPEDLPGVLHQLNSHLAGNSPGYEAEFRMRSKTGEWVWVLDRGRVMSRDENGRPLRMCGTHLDITARKNMEQDLQQAQKLESVGQLAAGIAHEINTPIQFVADNLRFLQESVNTLMPILYQYDGLIRQLPDRVLTPQQIDTLDETLQDADIEFLKEELPTSITQSLEGTDRVSKIVEALKTFAHPGSNVKEPADLNHAIETTLAIAANEWKHVAGLTTDFDPALPLVPCLVGEFNQVILNLLVNARDAIVEKNAADDGPPALGRITIRTTYDDKWAIIKVEDTGNGMSEKVKSRIFEPFYTTKEVGKGSGQGLAITRSVIVDKHDGRIAVRSEVGQGTTFEIKLPLAEDWHSA